MMLQLSHIAVELSSLKDFLIVKAKNGKTYEEIQNFLSDRSLFTKSLNDHKDYLHQLRLYVHTYLRTLRHSIVKVLLTMPCYMTKSYKAALSIPRIVSVN